MFMELVSQLDRAVHDLLLVSDDSGFCHSKFRPKQGRSGGRGRGQRQKGSPTPPRSKTPPCKFYDMLKLPYFKKLWGNDITIILNVFLGTMEGLNIRNLLWHGFLSVKQFDPGFTSLLVMAVISLPQPRSEVKERMLTERESVSPLTSYLPYARALDFGKGATVFQGTRFVHI